jgi:trehalose 6-phosphate synthase/phosphatase
MDSSDHSFKKGSKMISQIDPQSSRLVVISNRLPIVIEKKEGNLQVSLGSGGLVTALSPILQQKGGLWIGWPGVVDGSEKEMIPLLKNSKITEGLSFSPVFLTQEEISLYYAGFSNEILWPLFHDLLLQCHFIPAYWHAYQKVNAKFAEELVKNIRKDDFIWVQDYHLLLLGDEARKKGVTAQLNFFLHTPFPPLDIYLKLPWRLQVIQALLEYDLLGFQTMRDRKNFLHCVKALLPEAEISRKGFLHICKIGSRTVKIGNFPISIDYKSFEEMAASPEVLKSKQLIDRTIHEQKTIFSVDRLDYTKGIIFRLEAYRNFLETHPECHKKVAFVQVVVPSRTEIVQYSDLKNQIDRLVGEINSKFTQLDWVPIQYMFRAISKTELLAYYRASDIALITPIKDGMNLVCKEYIAANIDEEGVLILSEFAGACAQLYKDALVVNPFDIEGVTNAIYLALTMPQETRKKRMHKMRQLVKKYDIFWWIQSLFDAAKGNTESG